MFKSILKKTFIIVIAFTLVISNIAYASTENRELINYPENSIYNIKTNEENIPMSNYKSQNTSEVIDQVKNWKLSTKQILEKAYNQKVINIKEDDNYITFEYDYDTSLLEPQLLKTEYLKPSSNLANSNIPTKINYAWGWSDGYFKGDSKSGLWSAVKTVVIAIPGMVGKTVANIFSLVLGIGDAYLSANTPVTCETSVKYYYLNKIGYVQDQVFGYWLPYCYVGSRRGFVRYIGVVKDSSGQPITQKVSEKTGSPSNNPTNYDTIEKKSNFDNNTWIVNKAISQYQYDDGVYSDIFGTGLNLTPTLP
ncbi:hypothetical protein NE686_19415 [Tissierella carlieri]|uniref:Uncharacterized protein n=1 Tax=Tissierella carlieri TaxID=689904 RepID=A0ABT1SFZ8_9FIRM|nr:hypothetical protein [Tissierella carlieri]MCQ4925282.1 hypothetical protein [Tissierella carlieri]